MPRPNRPRSIASEQGLARRIAFERDARGMSYDGLASRMERAGCPIQPSAIYKIEKADPPRRITVDELVGFSRVFEIPVERLLLPPELAAADELVELVTRWDRAMDAAARAREAEEESWQRLRTWVGEHAQYQEQVREYLHYWSEKVFEGPHDFRVARWMWELTEDRVWKKRMKAAFDALERETL